MTNYNKGAVFERSWALEMEALGYFSIRAAGSHGLCDIVLIPIPSNPDQRIVLAQLKCGARPEKVSEAFKLWPVPASCVKWWVTKSNRKKWEKIEV